MAVHGLFVRNYNILGGATSARIGIFKKLTNEASRATVIRLFYSPDGLIAINGTFLKLERL